MELTPKSRLFKSTESSRRNQWHPKPPPTTKALTSAVLIAARAVTKVTCTSSHVLRETKSSLAGKWKPPEKSRVKHDPRENNWKLHVFHARDVLFGPPPPLRKRHRIVGNKNNILRIVETTMIAGKQNKSQPQPMLLQPAEIPQAQQLSSPQPFLCNPFDTPTDTLSIALAYPTSPTTSTIDTIQPTPTPTTAVAMTILVSSATEIPSPQSDVTHTTAESSPQPQPQPLPQSFDHPLPPEVIECQLPSEVMVQGVLIAEEAVVEGVVIESMVVQGVYEKVYEGGCGDVNIGDGKSDCEDDREGCLGAAVEVGDGIDAWMERELAKGKEENRQPQLLQSQQQESQQQPELSLPSHEQLFITPLSPNNSPPSSSQQQHHQQQQTNNIKHRQRQRRQQPHTSTGHIHKFA